MRNVSMMLIFFFTSLTLLAEPLSMEQSLRIGKENNPDYRISHLETRSAKNSYLNSYSPFIPSLNSSFSFSHQMNGPSSRLTDEFGNPYKQDPYDYYSGRIGGGMTLFDLSTFFQVRSQKAYYNALKFSEQQAELDLVLNIKTRYYNALAYRKLLEAATENIGRTQKQLDKIQKMFDLGIISQIDVIKQKGLLGKALLDSISNDKEYRTAIGKLNEILGRDPNQAIELTDNLDSSFIMIDYETLTEYAKLNHPLLKYSQASCQTRKFNYLSKWSDYFPSVNLGYGHSWGNSSFDNFDKFFDEDYNRYYGITFSWNIFDGFNRELSLKNQKIQYTIAKENLTKTKLSLIQSIQNAFLSVQEAREKIKVGQLNYTTATQEYQLAEEKYNLGAGGYLDLLDAQVNLINSQATLIQNLYSYQVALTVLENSTGYTIKK